MITVYLDSTDTAIGHYRKVDPWYGVDKLACFDHKSKLIGLRSTIDEARQAILHAWANTQRQPELVP